MTNSQDVFEQDNLLEPLDSIEEEEGFALPATWGYRVVMNQTVGGIESQIYEVYFNGEGNVEGWVAGRSAYGYDEENIDKSVSELRDDMERMLEAFDNESYILVVDGEDEYLEIVE